MDMLLIVAAAGIMIWWLARRMRKWLHEPPGVKLRRLARPDQRPEPDDATSLLEENGFEVLSGKHRIPLEVAVDDGNPQKTRLYFDYFAAKADKYYLVKLDRDRQPVDWTPSGLREKFLVYALLFPDCDGIVVADTKGKSVRTVRFQMEDDE